MLWARKQVRWAKASSHVTLFDTDYRLTQELRFDERGELVSYSLAGSMGARNISQVVRVEGGQATMDFDGEKMTKAFVPSSFVASDDTLASMNALLFERTMKSAGRHFIVPLLPQGKARVNRRGEDIFQVDGQSVRATRFFETGMTTKSSFAWMLSSGEMLVTTGADAKAFASRPRTDAAKTVMVPKARESGGSACSAQSLPRRCPSALLAHTAPFEDAPWDALAGSTAQHRGRQCGRNTRPNGHCCSGDQASSPVRRRQRFDLLFGL